MKNKKALAPIVATLVIILLTLIAISIVWITIKELTKDVALSPEMNCLDVKIQPPIKINSACYNSEKKQINLELKRNLEKIPIESILVSSDTNSEWRCSSSCGNCIILSEGEAKTYFLDEETKPNEIILKINQCEIETKEITDC